MDPDHFVIIFTVVIGVGGLVACWLTWRNLPKEPTPATDEEIERVFKDDTKVRAMLIDDYQHQKKGRKGSSEEDGS
ncbi:hypothetical protein [Ruegeria atlantica]|uniref:hypothetical protein n=1 Tax=Ruegeria atlantica TaxID=81569 RepID=UPI00147DD75E|nr:hypothetical protein [Ruegeria atlantica]